MKGDRPELGIHRRTTTTEGTLPAMWHKITNFFGGEGQKDGQPPRSHGRRNVETRRGRLHHDAKRRTQRESPAEQGVAVPFSLEMKMARPQVQRHVK
ncbi:hypothetical protein JTE90_005581 [Oedothorax gibbosus]|uniref:Uncharacterized protein n=1 Tax=Oedothorax gibbosus TaxID=931172 RepID=A0AAV6V9E5_9ARAC|nr:hypothetical protein JTE90_005581 [Oedothorax gibbosus]